MSFFVSFAQRKPAILGLFCALTFILGTEVATAESYRHAIDFQFGSANNLPANLHFKQGTYEKSLKADYSTRAFGPGAAPYYNLRYRNSWETLNWGGLSGFWWSIELLHHKMWLDNRPPEVEEFRMTFGHNLIPFSVGIDIYPWLAAYAGVGPVLVHAVSTINGYTIENSPTLWPTAKRYSLVGLGYQVGVELKYPLWKGLFVNGDLRYSSSYSAVPIAGGTARVNQISLHWHGGLGVQW